MENRSQFYMHLILFLGHIKSSLNASLLLITYIWVSRPETYVRKVGVLLFPDGNGHPGGNADKTSLPRSKADSSLQNQPQ